MKKLSTEKMKAMKGAFGPVYYCRRDRDCPATCTMEPYGPEVAYYCGGRVCQLALCMG